MRRAQWAGMALAFVGILVLFGEHLFASTDKAWIGDLMIVFAAMFWAGSRATLGGSSPGLPKLRESNGGSETPPTRVEKAAGMPRRVRLSGRMSIGQRVRDCLRVQPRTEVD